MSVSEERHATYAHGSPGCDESHYPGLRRATFVLPSIHSARSKTLRLDAGDQWPGRCTHASISTSAPSGNSWTATADRAGGSLSKTLAYSSFMTA
jgi:hypothetical protein